MFFTSSAIKISAMKCFLQSFVDTAESNKNHLFAEKHRIVMFCNKRIAELSLFFHVQFSLSFDDVQNMQLFSFILLANTLLSQINR